MPSVPSRTPALQQGLSGFVVPKAAAARRMRGAAGPASPANLLALGGAGWGGALGSVIGPSGSQPPPSSPPPLATRDSSSRRARRPPSERASSRSRPVHPQLPRRGETHRPTDGPAESQHPGGVGDGKGRVVGLTFPGWCIHPALSVSPRSAQKGGNWDAPRLSGPRREMFRIGAAIRTKVGR